MLSQHFAMKVICILEQPAFQINLPVTNPKNMMCHVQTVSVALYPKGWFQYGMLVMVIPLGQSQEESGKQDMSRQFWHVNSMPQTRPIPSQTCFCLVTGINSLPVT